jgi:hypothetical protein
LDFRFALVFHAGRFGDRKSAQATVRPAGLTGISGQERSPYFGREQEQILTADHGIDLLARDGSEKGR